MNFSQWLQALPIFRSFGFGGMLGGGIFGSLYLFVPALFAPSAQLLSIISIGVLLGGGLGTLLERLASSLMPALDRETRVYRNLFKAFSVRTLLGEETYQWLVRVLVASDALGVSVDKDVVSNQLGNAPRTRRVGRKPARQQQQPQQQQRQVEGQQKAGLPPASAQKELNPQSTAAGEVEDMSGAMAELPQLPPSQQTFSADS